MIKAETYKYSGLYRTCINILTYSYFRMIFIQIKVTFSFYDSYFDETKFKYDYVFDT